MAEGDEGVGADSVPAETLSRQARTGLTPHTWSLIIIVKQERCKGFELVLNAGFYREGKMKGCETSNGQASC